MTRKQLPTFCRVCEPSCGLLAEVENEQIVRLLPDKSHPVTKGFACHKGIDSLAIHKDPDRLNAPLKRNNPKTDAVGDFEPVSWDTAINGIAEKIRSVRESHGSGAFAAYVGNPTAFNSLATPAIGSFLLQLGCRKLFGAGTQDCSNKFAAAEAVFGTSTLHPVPDIEHTDYLLIFGENPKVSHMSFISIADPMAKLRAARQRGATINFINPRAIESATPKTGEVVQIKPDTDLYLLAAMIHEIARAELLDQATLRDHGKHVQELLAFVARYPADRVADVVGIPAESIRRMACDFASAPAASVHMSTGVNMGRQGTLCYWLLQMLSFITGNLDRKGGNLYAEGFYPAAKAGRIPLDNLFFDSPFGKLRTIRGSLPGNLLPEFIESDTDPVKVLFVMAGNPLLSIGGEQRLRSAFKQLELIVVIDLYRNATAELADYVLPATDMLERSDINICGLGMQYEPFVQYTDAIVPPAHERKEEWWILARLEQAIGLNSVLDDPGYNPHGRNDKMLSRAGLSIDSLKQQPSQTRVLDKLTPGKFYSHWLQTDDNKVDCAPPLFDEALEKAESIFRELTEEAPQTFKLIHLRNNYMHNSWYQNVQKLKRGRHTSNPLYMNPQDAEAAGYQEGDKVQVSNAYGSIKATLVPDASLRSGVVAMSHGWGNSNTPGMRIASEFPGVNVNRLLPRGPGSYETLSNQAHMTGIPVEIGPL